MEPKPLIFFASSVIALILTSCVTHSAKAEKPKPYPFNYCAVIKKEFDEEEGPKYGRIHDGYQVKFCCYPCTKAFDVNPEAFMGPIREYYAKEAALVTPQQSN